MGGARAARNENIEGTLRNPESRACVETRVILQISPDSAPIVHVAATAVLYLHIGSGLVALLAGPAALMFRKGSRLHRLAGNVFVTAMLIMATIGAAVSPFLQPPQWVNVTAGVFMLYLVVSAWLTMKRRGPAGPTEFTMFGVAVVIAGSAIATGLIAMSSAEASIRSDAAASFIFAGVVTLAAFGDLRLILRRELSRVQRWVRHLWRMCYALLIAAASLFLGQPQVFPESVRGTGLLFVPVLAVLLTMIFWLVRVRRPSIQSIG